MRPLPSPPLPPTPPPRARRFDLAAPVAPPPPQWLPGFIRWPIRVLLWPFVALDDAVQRLVQRFLRPQWTLQGACHRRGACCRHVLIAIPAVLDRHPRLRRWVLAYFTQVQGFYEHAFAVELDGDAVTSMGCRYLLPGGSCAHHHLRPGICRRYPHSSGAPPNLLPGCGFHLRPSGPPALKVLP